MTPSERRFDLPGGLSPQEEAAVLAALAQYFAEDGAAPASTWALAGRIDATGMGALQSRGVSGWRAGVRMTFARAGVPPFHGRGDSR